jgi:hypothetical protein
VSQDQSLAGGKTVLLNIAIQAISGIVVAGDQVQSILALVLVQEVKDRAVGPPNVVELPVLPQLVAVTDLDVCVPFIVVVTECAENEFSISRKAIGLAAIAAV